MANLIKLAVLTGLAGHFAAWLLVILLAVLVLRRFVALLNDVLLLHNRWKDRCSRP
jgi:hypothetical protein